jgi:hypothetical protein
MSLTEVIAKDLIRSMGKEERERFVDRVLDEFFRTMSLEDRKAMMHRFLPKIVDEMVQGMPVSDRKQIVDELIPIIRAEIVDNGKKAGRN